MAQKVPAFQFYPADFLADPNVIVMSLTERGAYITLLCICWHQGSLPADPSRLARLCGVPLRVFQKLWPALQPCFRVGDSGALVHPRLELEREKQAEFRRRQSMKGKASAANRTSTTVQPRLDSGSTTIGSTLHLQSSSSDFSHTQPGAREGPHDPTPSSVSPEVAMRAGKFCQETFPELHAKYCHGAKYLSKPHLDYQEALLLCQTWDDERLEKLARVFLNSDDEFITNGTRSIAKFRSRASWADGLLREKGL